MKIPGLPWLLAGVVASFVARIRPLTIGLSIALGVIFSAVTVIKDGSVNHIIMLSGAVICFIFGGLLFIGYKKQQSDTRNR